jgi:hypothetical protein
MDATTMNACQKPLPHLANRLSSYKKFIIHRLPLPSLIFGIFFWILALAPGLQAQVGPVGKGSPLIENLGNIIGSATLEKRYQFYLPYKKQTHLLLCYVILDYWKQPFQIWDINLDTGKNRVVDGLIGRPGPHATLLHSNGLIYIGSGDPGFFMVYDPDTGHSRKIEKLADKGAQYIIEGDDGAVYIGEAVKGIVERYDPKDGSWENYGIMDDPGPPYYRYAYTLGADKRHIYIAVGQNPWYLVIYDRLDKTQKVFWKDQKPQGVTIYKGQGGGWVASCTTNSGQTNWYKLRGGQPELLTVKPSVVSAQAALVDTKQPGYEVDLGQAIPDTGNGGKATVRWRQGIGQKWQQTSAQLRMGPMDIKRLYGETDSTLFGFTSFYGPVFTYDPGKHALTILGRPQRSLYDALFFKGDWFFAGYPAAIMRYNPAQPWNLTGSTADLFDLTKNPRLLKVAYQGSAKYHYFLAHGADGSIYFGGHHERTGVGGSLGWFNPKTGVTGGLREPFLQYDVSDLMAAEEGSKIVFSSHGVDQGLDGKLFVFDVHQKKVIATLAPLLGVSDAGKILEVAPGVVLGVVSGKPKSRVYKADLRQGKVLWQKELEGTAFGGVRGFDRRLIRGPDGRVWLYMNNRICRINPADGSLQEVMEAAPSGNLLFINKDLYIYGGTSLRKVSGLFQNISEN